MDTAFFCVGDALGDVLGDVLGDAFRGLQKRNVLKGDVFGDAKCLILGADLYIYNVLKYSINAVFSGFHIHKIPYIVLLIYLYYF